MSNTIPDLKTDTRLLQALTEAATRKLTASEIFEQRVSFVVGSLGSKNSVTRDRIKEVIHDQEGRRG